MADLSAFALKKANPGGESSATILDLERAIAGADASGMAGTGAVFAAVVMLSQAQYDALATKNPAILYVIPGA
ncbi:phage upper tail fiber protein [Rhizobium sp. N324]|uniref:phage upper tail fiber protein n=1 Tax=Rhizobium sp. N324 TaxID=1703969 RepID=UPI0007E9DF63|nr:hypothetical protein [Rhizobium sp. N324]ANM12030.1 hypothetical protein AMK05_CH03681 [Rhizobium sp. N324]